MDAFVGLLFCIASLTSLNSPQTDAMVINRRSSDTSIFLCGTEVTLVCTVDNPADSFPVIAWKRDTLVITRCFNSVDDDCLDLVIDGHIYFTSDITAKTYTLTFNTIRMESAGVWSCDDSNNAAQQTLYVIELPSDTTTVSVINNGTSYVTLECETNCVTTESSSFEVSWEYQDGSSTKTLTPIDGSTSTETSLPCTATGHCVLSTSEQHRRTAKFITSSSCSPIIQVRAKITTTDKQLTNGVDCEYIAYTDYISTYIQENIPTQLIG